MEACESWILFSSQIISRFCMYACSGTIVNGNAKNDLLPDLGDCRLGGRNETCFWNSNAELVCGLVAGDDAKTRSPIGCQECQGGRPSLQLCFSDERSHGYEISHTAETSG